MQPGWFAAAICRLGGACPRRKIWLATSQSCRLSRAASGLISRTRSSGKCSVGFNHPTFQHFSFPAVRGKRKSRFSSRGPSKKESGSTPTAPDSTLLITKVFQPAPQPVSFHKFDSFITPPTSLRRTWTQRALLQVFREIC